MKRLRYEFLMAALMMAGLLALPAAQAADYPSGTQMGKKTDAGATSPRSTGSEQMGTPEPERTATPGETGQTSEPSGTGQTTVQTGSLEPSDLELTQKLHQVNQKEIALGRLAQEKASSARVRSYARMLVSHHTSADRRLLALLDKKDVDRAQLEQAATSAGERPTSGTEQPSGDTKPTAEMDETYQRLANLSGAEFDREFITTMIDEHEKAIELVRTSTDQVRDTEFRSHLRRVLPTLEQHRKMAQTILEKHLRA